MRSRALLRAFLRALPRALLKALLKALAAGVVVLSACTPSTPAQPTAGPQAGGGTASTPTSTTTSGRTASAPTRSTEEEFAAPGAGAHAGDQPTSGGRVVLGQLADARTLNPVTVSDIYSDVVTSRIYAGLTSVDAKTGQVVPNLAEQFDISADGKTLTFQLRDELKFSDGSPLTGDDFKFTVMATLRSKKTNHRSSVETIAGARDFIDGTASDVSGIGVDGNTITVTLVNSFCPALSQIGGLGIIPQSVFGKYVDPSDASKNLDDAPENTAPPVASGAFVFKEWVANDHITLARNENFWQKPNVDEWVHRPYPTQDALNTALKSGDVDMAHIDPKDLPDIQSEGSLQVFKYPELGYTFIGWNQMRGGKEFLQDKVVRQALAYGLNIDQVIDKAVMGEGVRLTSHTSPASWAFDATGFNDYKFDPGKAEQLLQDAGWTKGSDGVYEKDGQRLELTIVTNSGNAGREAMLQLAAEQYKAIGVSVTPKTEGFDALLARINTSRDQTYGSQGGRDFDAVVIGWSLSADPDMYSIFDSNSTHQGENNFIQYKNADLDKAISDSRTHCVAADRKAAIKAANQILNDEQPYNFGFAGLYLLGVNRRVHGVVPGPFARQGQATPEAWWVQ